MVVVAVSVIIPARDAAATIGRTLHALAEQDLDEAYEVIVVDDDSHDGTPEIVAASQQPVTLLHAGGVGPGPARNLGVRQASGQALAFTDADCFPATSWLREGLHALSRADLVQGAVRPDPMMAPEPFDRTVWVVRESGLYETANLFIDRGLFTRIGGFEDWLGPTIGKPLAEDVWLGWRARRAGATTRFSSQPAVHHAVFRRSARDYVLERRRLVYFPAMVQRMPELRVEFLWRRIFLSRRSAAFDAAVVAAGAAAAGAAIAFPGGLIPLAAAGPYLWIAASAARPWGRRAAMVAMASALADAVGLLALAWGSVHRRTPVL